MCELDFAAYLKDTIADSIHGYGYATSWSATCSDLPTENAAFLVELDSGERFAVIVQQIGE